MLNDNDKSGLTPIKDDKTIEWCVSTTQYTMSPHYYSKQYSLLLRRKISEEKFSDFFEKKKIPAKILYPPHHARPG
jgi:hypothetical protein